MQDNQNSSVVSGNPDRRDFLKVGAAVLAAPVSMSAAAQAVTERGSSASEITGWTAVQLSRAIQSRNVSCVEVMGAYLTQIDRINPKVNAIVSLQARDTLLAQAGERDTQLAEAKAAGKPVGWMHGFPQAPKDLTNTAGIVTTQGSPIFKNYVPKFDSIVVERER